MKESEKQLIRELLKNSRTSHEDLGARMGKSRNWVARTIRKLVEKGTIRAFTTVVNPALVYSERNTILLVKTNPREIGVSQALVKMAELESLDGISGEYSLLGLLRFRSPARFNQFLDQIDRIVAKSGAQTYKMVQVLTTYKANGFVLNLKHGESPTLSARDWRLLRTITRWRVTEEDSYPPSQQAIGEAMRPMLTQPAVSRAIRQLEHRGVIIGYSVDICFRHIGLPIKFFLQIRTRPGSITTAAKRISAMKEVWNLHRVGDAYSLYATVRTESVEAYNRFLRELYKHRTIIDTYSQISLEEWQLQY